MYTTSVLVVKLFGGHIKKNTKQKKYEYKECSTYKYNKSITKI